MADLPPEVPPGLPLAFNESNQSPFDDQPLSDQPHVSPSDLPEVGLADGHPDQSQSPVVSTRPPLAELSLNGENLPVGEVVFSAKAVFKKPSSARTPVAPSHRKFKKMKTAASKTHPVHHLTNEDWLQKNSMDTVLDARVCSPSDAGSPAVITPLRIVEAEDVPPGDGDDYTCSDFEEDEDDFDLEAYYVDKKKRVELSSLMEKYGVYDEEQLRLAIRRERRQQKRPSPIAGIPSRSPDSAPASPTRTPSKFIPPISHDPLPLIEGSNPTIIAQDSTFHTRLAVTAMDNIPMLPTPMQPSHMQTIPMQPIPMHHTPMLSTPMSLLPCSLLPCTPLPCTTRPCKPTPCTPLPCSTRPCNRTLTPCNPRTNPHL